MLLHDRHRLARSAKRNGPIPRAVIRHRDVGRVLRVPFRPATCGSVGVISANPIVLGLFDGLTGFPIESDDYRACTPAGTLTCSYRRAPAVAHRSTGSSARRRAVVDVNIKWRTTAWRLADSVSAMSVKDATLLFALEVPGEGRGRLPRCVRCQRSSRMVSPLSCSCTRMAISKRRAGQSLRAPACTSSECTCRPRP